MANSKVFYEVICKKHGLGGLGMDSRQLKVNVPLTKKQRFEGGCPFCKSERKKAEYKARQAKKGF